MIQKLLRYLNNLDARVVRAVAVSALLLLVIALILVMGRTTAIFDEDDAPIFNWLKESADSPWGLPATIVVYVLAAFLGAPQFVLIAGTVVAFGPMRGFAYSWAATMVSAGLNFWMARALGANLLRRYGGGSINRISEMIGSTGFWSALIVRIVPSAPFIVVNMAAGVSHMRASAFLLGTALGIVPKTAVVAFFGGSIMKLAEGENLTMILALGGAVLGWIVAVVWARRAMRRRSAPAAGAAQPEPAAPEPAIPEPAAEAGHGGPTAAAPAAEEGAREEAESLAEARRPRLRQQSR